MKIKINNIFFYTAYFIFLFSCMFEAVVCFLPILWFLKFMSLTMLLIKFFISFKSGYKKITIIKITIVMICAAISFYYSRDEKYFILLLFLVAAKDINIDKFIKFDVKLKVLFMLTIILLFFMGYTNVYNMTRSDGMIRYSMGFSHPNVFAAYVFFIMAEVFYLLYKKNRLCLFIMLLCAFFLIDKIANSRSVMLGLIFLMVFTILDFEKIKIVKKIPTFKIFIVFFMLSLIIGYTFNESNAFYKALNLISSQRIYFMHKYLSQYNINLFGNHIVYVSSLFASKKNIEAMILDNSYLLFLLKYGILNFAVFSCLIKKVLDKYENNNFLLKSIFVALIIFGFFESTFIYINTNVFLLFLSKVFFNDRKDDEFLYEKKSAI